jgi:hypothetical protein
LPEKRRFLASFCKKKRNIQTLAETELRSRLSVGVVNAPPPWLNGLGITGDTSGLNTDDTPHVACSNGRSAAGRIGVEWFSATIASSAENGSDRVIRTFMLRLRVNTVREQIIHSN